MKKAGDVDEKPGTYNDAQHGRFGEQEIRRSGMPILGRVECIHTIFSPIILPRWRGPTTDLLTNPGSAGVATNGDLCNEPSRAACRPDRGASRGVKNYIFLALRCGELLQIGTRASGSPIGYSSGFGIRRYILVRSWSFYLIAKSLHMR